MSYVKNMITIITIDSDYLPHFLHSNYKVQIYKAHGQGGVWYLRSNHVIIILSHDLNAVP